MSLNRYFYLVGALAILHSVLKFYWISVIIEQNESNIDLKSIHSKNLILLLLFVYIKIQDILSQLKL